MERYDPIKDTWKKVANMQEGRYELCACVVEDQFIYVFGGFTDSIEKYDAESIALATIVLFWHKGPDWIL